jgi:hypothetical protein
VVLALPLPWVHGLWGLAVVAGLAGLAAHGARPGSPGLVSGQWPQGAGLVLAGDRPTMCLFVHPRCPCSRATAQQLEELLATAAEEPEVAVIHFLPPGSQTDPAWTAGPLLERLAALPRAALHADLDGALSQHFGVETSGHVLIYGPQGELRFAGGLTPSRGHLGPNPGLARAAAALSGAATAADHAVFGCALHTPCPAPDSTPAAPHSPTRP